MNDETRPLRLVPQPRSHMVTLTVDANELIAVLMAAQSYRQHTNPEHNERVLNACIHVMDRYRQAARPDGAA